MLALHACTQSVELLAADMKALLHVSKVPFSGATVVGAEMSSARMRELTPRFFALSKGRRRTVSRAL